MMNAKIQLASEKNLEELLPFVRAYHEFEELKLTPYSELTPQSCNTGVSPVGLRTNMILPTLNADVSPD